MGTGSAPGAKARESPNCDLDPTCEKWLARAPTSAPEKVFRVRRVFFRPSGAWMDLFDVLPAMNRWAIIGRPCGTSARSSSHLDAWAPHPETIDSQIL